MEPIQWTNEKRRLGDLIAWEKNPRLILKDQAERLVNSLEEFGQIQEIAIEPDNMVIDGHQREKCWSAAEQFGPDYLVDVRVSSRKLTEQERKKLVIYLHKGTTGEFDWDMIANEWDLDDLLKWGFSAEELLGVHDSWGRWAMDPGAKQDQAAELQVKWGTQPGQIWAMGSHRLACGSCTDAELLDQLFQGQRATLTFTSPPYFVGKEYEQQKSVPEIIAFIRQVAEQIARVTQPDESRIIINTGTGFTTAFDKRHKRQTLLLIDKWTDAFYDLGWNLRHVRHWLKNGQLASISAKADMIDQHCEWFATYENDQGAELHFDDRIDQEEVQALLTFYNSDGASRGRGQQKAGGRFSRAKSWALAGYWADIPGEAGKNNHVAAYPLQVVERHLVLYTKRGEIVFEPFSGSGTNLVAGERLGRQVRAVELDPGYCAVSLERWHELTGLQPQIVETLRQGEPSADG